MTGGAGVGVPWAETVALEISNKTTKIKKI
jgi:hypothetical protein